MINYNQEYYSSPYYFFLRDMGDKVSLYYSVGETLNESRRSDRKRDFDKKDSPKIKSLISKILSKKKKPQSTDEVEKELDELIEPDGSFATSSTPILDLSFHPRRTMDQTVITTRQTNNPVTRGYSRIYYGESKEEEPVVNEVDYSEAFGYEETKNLDGKKTYKTLVKKMGMEPEEAKARTKQFGKDPTGKRDKKSKYRNKKGFIAKLTLSEMEKLEMKKMIENLLSKKNSDDADVIRKDMAEDTPVSRMVKKNLDSIKKMAEKGGISINQLIKMLRSE
jgi:hypothetical protein